MVHLGRSMVVIFLLVVDERDHELPARKRRSGVAIFAKETIHLTNETSRHKR